MESRPKARAGSPGPVAAGVPFITHENDAPMVPLGAQMMQVVMDPEAGGSSRLTIGRSHWPAGGAGQPHAHEGWEEMFYVLSGEGELLAGEQRYTLKPGMVVCVPERVPHCVASVGRDGLEMVFLLAPGVPGRVLSPAAAARPREGAEPGGRTGQGGGPRS
ncbi:MAG: cupin domain-containing protein [Bacillota bacterium]